MTFTNPSRSSGIGTKLAFIHLERDQTDGSPGYPKFLICSGPAKGAVPLAKGFDSVRALPRPQGDADGLALTSVALDATDITFTMELNELAGGMPHTLVLSSELFGTSAQLLNNWSSYVGGIQNGLQFTRNEKYCRPRTGGSRYSGKKGIHTQWDVGSDWPEKPFGDGDTPMTTYSNVDKQGAVLLKRGGVEGAQVQVLTAPIELDPDGWGTDGTDHGIEEDVGTDETLPEALLPVIYHGIVCETTWDVVAPGVIAQTTTWKCLAGGRTPVDVAVTGAWRIWAPRFRMTGVAADARFVDDDTLLDALSTLTLGEDTYDDEGDVYEMSALDTERNGVSEGDTLLSGARGLIMKDTGTICIGIGILGGPTGVLADGSAATLTNVPKFVWSDRLDLSGDTEAGAKHHFMGIAYDVSADSIIPATLTSVCYIVAGTDAADVAARFAQV